MKIHFRNKDATVLIFFSKFFIALIIDAVLNFVFVIFAQKEFQ